MLVVAVPRGLWWGTSFAPSQSVSTLRNTTLSLNQEYLDCNLPAKCYFLGGANVKLYMLFSVAVICVTSQSASAQSLDIYSGNGAPITFPAPAPYAVYRPVTPIVASPPAPVAVIPTAPITTLRPVLAPPTTAIPPALPTTVYSPVNSFQSVTTYSPVIVQSPVTAYRPVVTYPPIGAVGVQSYYAPVVTPVPAAYINPKVYIPGQPIRNLIQAITP